LRTIWTSLTTPSAYRGDWYGWATNQLGHVMIGMALACAGTVAYFMVLGEFPFKWHLFAVIGCGYLAFELTFQKWQGWDTLEDWLFVCAYGAGGAITTVTEYEIGSLVADIDLRGVAWAFALAAGHLAVGVGLRLRRADD
jgi:hypothetical protein